MTREDVRNQSEKIEELEEKVDRLENILYKIRYEINKTDKFIFPEHIVDLQSQTLMTINGLLKDEGF